MSKETLNLRVEEEIKEKAKILSAKTKLSVSKIFELFIGSVKSEKDVLKLAEKENVK